MERGKINIASLCFEAVLAQKFHIYAGGLAVVQAGLLKSGANPNLPINFYGLGILWSNGYYDQKIGSHGMIVSHKRREYDFLEDTGVRIVVRVDGHPNTVKVWYLKPDIFDTAPAFFLDTDIDENDALARSITQHLYGGNERTRLAQEIVLGIGGVRAFEALGIPIDVYHGQEGHSVLAGIEILNKHMATGLNFDEALRATRRKFVFTTHTPELAGNESHALDLMMQMGCFPNISRENALHIGGYHVDQNRFNMTVAGFRLAKISNAVSQLHLETACQMWKGVDDLCPLISVTNGVDDDWQYPEFLQATTPDDLQSAQNKYKEKLFKLIEKRTGKKLRKDILTIVWARRQTEYKRLWLMFMDWPWLKKLLQDGQIQIIVAGKPHPQDQPAINYFNWVYEKSLEVDNLVVLSGFEYDQNKLLKAGCDLWLQTPRRPREACGTSWMSVPNLVMSSKDGGILESNPDNYFPFGVDYPCQTGEQDTIDFQEFKSVLMEVKDMYYNDKTKWYRKMLAAMQEKRQKFSSDRMLQDYIDKMYLS